MDQPTVSEWRRRRPHMTWEIFDKESVAAMDSLALKDNRDLCEAHDRLLLDLNAPRGLPDGSYTITCDRGPVDGFAPGVIVEHGRFSPENIHDAALAATCHSFRMDLDAVRNGRDRAPDHVHIEAVTWDPARDTLLLQLGS